MDDDGSVNRLDAPDGYHPPVVTLERLADCLRVVVVLPLNDHPEPVVALEAANALDAWVMDSTVDSLAACGRRAWRGPAPRSLRRHPPTL